LIQFVTMASLAYVMIRVGYEFEFNRARLRSYAVDYGVASVSAALPWLLCSLYFALVLTSPEAWTKLETWTHSLLTGRFAAPTSAGVLFAMLGAAGLSATWVFRKARILAIFDDLDTILLLIPLKFLVIGAQWQLGVVFAIVVTLLWLAWRYFRGFRLPSSWRWTAAYAVVIAGTCEAFFFASGVIDPSFPVHLEVLLPAFVMGCIVARRSAPDSELPEGAGEHDSPQERRVASIVAGAFMLLVGLSMPAVAEIAGGMSWRVILGHALAITLLSNLGKMFPLFTYRRESTWRERFALCIGMWPRGEVGAGILVLVLAQGIGGPAVAVAGISLGLNLAATGLFIAAVKGLLTGTKRARAPVPAPA
jgi:Kef-type K+ transport system membrane component KefB